MQSADISARMQLALSAGADLILNKREVAALRGVSVSTIDRMRREGRFPEPERLSPRRVGWKLSAVQSV